MKSVLKIKILLLLLVFASVSGYAQFSGGNGTEANPYQIRTRQHLELLADSVSNCAPSPADNWSKGKYFKIMNGIDDSIRTVIGSNSHPFQGNFDGQGYSITLAIAMNFPTQHPGIMFWARIGLFGVTMNAAIKNVIVNGYVRAGDRGVGGIVGYAIESTTITNCINLANITSNANHVGGISGYNEKTVIKNCTNLGNVRGTNCIGGITSCGFDAVINCINAGHIRGGNFISSYPPTGGVGGIAGYSGYGSVINSINIGVVEVNKESPDGPGGITGQE